MPKLPPQDGGPDETEVFRALAEQNGMEFLEEIPPVPPQALALLPDHLARHFNCLPIRVDHPGPAVVIANPLDFEMIDTVTFVISATSVEVEFLVAPPSVLAAAIEKYCGEMDFS